MNNENEGVARFSRAPTTVELRVMYFIEHTYMVVRKHLIANNVISILFFLYLYLNTIITRLAKEEKIKINTKLVDAISLLTSLNFVNSNSYEIKVSLIFVTLAVFTVFFISILAFSLSIAYRHVLISAFQIIVIYITPPLFVVFVSVFQHSYMTINKEWSPSLYFGIFGHSLFIFIVTMTALFLCISPYICNHPFLQRNFTSASITLFYIIIISHLDCYFFKLNLGMQILRIIVSFLMCVFILIANPYYNRNMNAALFSFAFFNFLTSLTVTIWPRLQLFSLIFIPVSFIITGLLFYLIFPYYYKKWYPKQEIFFEFFLGHVDKAYKLLDQMQNQDADNKNISNIISIAFYLNSPQLPSLLHFYFSQKKYYIGDMIHMWIILHLYNAAHHGQTPIFSSLIESNERKISHLEEQFWHDAWLSDVTNLPVIASSLGRKIMNTDLVVYQQNYLIRETFPYLENPVQYETKHPISRFETKYKLKDLQSAKYLFKKFFRIHEISLLITIIFYIIFMVCTQIYLTVLSKQSNSYNNLIDFTNEFYSFHLKDGSLTDLYSKYNKTVSTNLGGIKQFYTDTGFISAFETYFNEVEKTSMTNFPYNSFNEFIKVYLNTLRKFSNAFQPLIDSTHKNLRIWYILFLLFFSILAVVPPIIKLVILKRKLVKYYEKFRYIPKKEILKIGNIDPHLTSFDKHWVDRSYSICKSFPLSLAITIIYFLISVMFIFITYNCASFGWEYLEHMESSIYVVSNVHTIPINLVQAVYSNPNEAIRKAQQIANLFLSDHKLYFLMMKFPQSFYDLIGSKIFNPDPISISSSNDTLFVVSEICELIDNEIQIEIFTTTYQHQRVLFYIIDLGLFVWLVLFIVMQISPITNCEVEMGKYLYKKIINQIIPETDSNTSISESIYLTDDEGINNTNIDSISEAELDDIQIDQFPETELVLAQKVDLKHEWSIDDIPLIIIVIDTSFKIKYQTKMAKSITQIEKGEKFENSKLENSILFDIKSAFQNFMKERGNPVSIPFGHQESLIISPFYKTKKTLDYIMIVDSNEPPNASIEIFNKLSHAFYSIYPKIIPLNQSFPFEIQSNGRPFFILFFQLIGFNEWCDTTDLIVAEKFRKDVSKLLDNLLANESNFCRVRESSDLVVMMMNRETKLSIWKILEVCAEFGNNILEMIQKLTLEYEAPSIHGCVLFFKVREPNYYFTSRKCGRTDLEGDSIFTGERRLTNCMPEIVNYTSQKKELKVSNTTKLKTCYTPNGEEYELLIVV